MFSNMQVRLMYRNFVLINIQENICILVLCKDIWFTYDMLFENVIDCLLTCDLSSGGGWLDLCRVGPGGRGTGRHHGL